MRAWNFPNAVLAYKASEHLTARYFPIRIQNYFQCQILLIDEFDIWVTHCAMSPSPATRPNTFLATVIGKCSVFHMSNAVAFLYAQEKHNEIWTCNITRMRCLPAVGKHLTWRGRGRRVWVIEARGKDVQDEMPLLVQKKFREPKVIQQHNEIKTVLGRLCLFVWVLVEHLLN